MDTMYLTHNSSFLHEMGALYPDSDKRIDSIYDHPIMSSSLMPYINSSHSSLIA